MSSRPAADCNRQYLRVLVVDDDPLALELFWRHLPSDQFQVATASDGSQALEMLQSEAFDILVTDIVMPGLNGLNLISCVRSMLHLRHLPILVSTGYMADPTRTACLQAGADELITKPFRTSQLPHLLNLMVLSRQQDSLEAQ